MNTLIISPRQTGKTKEIVKLFSDNQVGKSCVFVRCTKDRKPYKNFYPVFTCVKDFHTYFQDNIPEIIFIDEYDFFTEIYKVELYQLFKYLENHTTFYIRTTAQKLYNKDVVRYIRDIKSEESTVDIEETDDESIEMAQLRYHFLTEPSFEIEIRSKPFIHVDYLGSKANRKEIRSEIWKAGEV